MQENRWRPAESSGYLDRAEEVLSIGNGMRELLKINGGQYSETLRIGGDGHTSTEHRTHDAGIPWLSNMLSREASNGGKMVGPTSEDIYQLLHQVAISFPSIEVEIVENDSRTEISYTISERK
jgi:hypothetical protein